MGMVRGALISFIYLYLALYTVPLFAESTAQKVYGNAKDSIFPVYSIDEDDDNNSAFGTGVAITKNLIATNCHVALSGNSLVVEVNQKKHTGRLYYYNKKNDLCVIELKDVTLHPVKIRPSKSVSIGEDVFAIGNPEGHEKTISRGIISNRFMEDGVEILQTDAGISHGSSGGGLFDMDGNLVGVTFATHEEASNMTFALPTELIMEVLNNPKKPEIEMNEPKLATVKSSGRGAPSHVDVTPGTPANNSQLTHLGSYGTDEVGLAKWRGKCFITITGKYKSEPKSLAVWFPHAADGIFIFSHLVNVEDAIHYFKTMIDDDNNVDYTASKSYLYFDKTLYPLPIMTIGIIKQPVYVYVAKKEMTQQLLELDNFMAQFYGYTQKDGMTTITFGLSGFTEAFSAFGKKCK